MEKKIVYFCILMSVAFEWYLLDEPFAGVDKKNRDLMKRIINDRCKDGKGILLITHENDGIDGLENSVTFELSDIPVVWKYKKAKEGLR